MSDVKRQAIRRIVSTNLDPAELGPLKRHSSLHGEQPQFISRKAKGKGKAEVGKHSRDHHSRHVSVGVESLEAEQSPLIADMFISSTSEGHRQYSTVPQLKNRLRAIRFPDISDPVRSCRVCSL